MHEPGQRKKKEQVYPRHKKCKTSGQRKKKEQVYPRHKKCKTSVNPMLNRGALEPNTPHRPSHASD
uniref:Uncharacterized protein n=1 Tax=Helianthus annuus TaxID=4232 RepID=A0A251TLH5_HELAN